MELDVLFEGTYTEVLSLLPILVAGYVGLYFAVKANFLLQWTNAFFTFTSDIRLITANINQRLVGILPFQFLRVFLLIRRIRSFPDPFPIVPPNVLL